MGAPLLRCRRIAPPDFEVVLDLLERGFPERTRAYWTTALAALRGRVVPEGASQYGYLLEADGRPVGAHLQIFSAGAERQAGEIRCHASAWYVEPAYRSHAALLAAVASRLKHVTYVNTTASPHTWPTLEAVGYRRYTQGQFVAVPALSRARGATVTPLGAAHASFEDYQLLRAHERAGCLALVCETNDGPKPFVFKRRRVRQAPIGVTQLVWCRDTAAFVECAGAIGRFLLRQGAICVMLDADGPVAGLAGFYFADRNPRFFKGPHPPRINDLAYSESVLLDGWARAAPWDRVPWRESGDAKVEREELEAQASRHALRGDVVERGRVDRQGARGAHRPRPDGDRTPGEAAPARGRVRLHPRTV